MNTLPSVEGGSIPPAGPPKGRAKACTACRQVKLKCDAREVYPNPCSRCKTQDLECRMDPTFKRVPARRQLEEVSNRLIHLQRSLGLDQNSEVPPGSAGGGAGASGGSAVVESFGEPLVDQTFFSGEGQGPDRTDRRFRRASSDGSSVRDHPSPEASRFLDLHNPHEQGSWQLGDVSVNAGQALMLFRKFDKTLWRHIPILEPCHSFHQFHKASELLFWTVILVSARLYNEYDELYLQLIPHHRALLSSKVFGERASLKNIHAILLLCTWPYPVSSQYDDLTWVLCGTAINMAMMLGLHKPEHTHEYGHEWERIPGPEHIRNLTWLSLFQTVTSVGSWYGMPPPLNSASHLETIENLCRDPIIPKAYRAKADIQRHVAQITTALDSNIEFRTRYSLIKMYENDLDRVHNQFSDVWTDALEIELLAAKLFLFGMAFVSNTGDSSQREPSKAEKENRAHGAREILQLGLSAASRLLNGFASIKLPHTSAGENHSGCSDYIYQLAFYPKHFFRIAAFANFYLLWYLAVDAGASEQDKELAKTFVGFAYRFLGSFKHSPEHLRAAKGIELMSRVRSLRNGPSASNLLVNTRLGASFMYSLSYRDKGRIMLDQNTSVDLPPYGYDAPKDDRSKNPQDVHSPGDQLAAGDVKEEPDEQPPIRLDDGSLAYSPLRTQETPSRSNSMSQTSSTQEMHSLRQQIAGSMAKEAYQMQPQQQQQQQQTRQQAPFPGSSPPFHQTSPQNTMAQMNPETVFSNVFFQDVNNQNYDFLWQEWDPAVFDDLKMDVDEMNAMNTAVGNMGVSPGSGSGMPQNPGGFKNGLPG